MQVLGHMHSDKSFIIYYGNRCLLLGSHLLPHCYTVPTARSEAYCHPKGRATAEYFEDKIQLTVADLQEATDAKGDFQRQMHCPQNVTTAQPSSVINLTRYSAISSFPSWMCLSICWVTRLEGSKVQAPQIRQCMATYSKDNPSSM